jgi:hypothetical protein
MASISRRIGLTLGCLLGLALAAQGAGPAEGLFRLVPPDAAATLAIEDLRGHAREFLGSPVAEGLQRLPEFQTWLASDRFAQFEQARQRIEHALGESLTTVRDELLGDAVVLTLRTGPNGRPEEARGLFLARVRNRPLLEKLLRDLNAAQQRSGELARTTRRNHSGVSYWCREFQPTPRGQRPAEYLTVLADNCFAWSNAEDLILGVIDRSAGKARSLADEPRFQRVRRRLPEPAAISLFLDPLFLTRVLAASTRPPKRPVVDRASALVGRYLGAMDYLGAALQWRDGLVLQTEELLDPDKLDPWVRRWAARPPERAPSLSRVPATALAVASVQADFVALLDVLRLIIPEPQQQRLENLILTLNGLLLGRDLQAEILPQMGPGVIAYAEPPGADRTSPEEGFSKVFIVGLASATGLTDALENALQTFLSSYALDPRHGGGQLRLESREVAGRTVTALTPSSPLAFAVENDRLILGSTRAAVARALTSTTTPAAASLEALRTREFPQAGSFLWLDLARLHDDLVSRRPAIVARLAARNHSSVEKADRDLDQAVALTTLFQQAYATSRIEPDATAVHRALRLIARPTAAPRGSPPTPAPTPGAAP